MRGTLQVVPVLFNAPSLGRKQAKIKQHDRQGGTGKNQQYIVFGTVGPKLEGTSNYRKLVTSYDNEQISKRNRRFNEKRFWVKSRGSITLHVLESANFSITCGTLTNQRLKKLY